MKKAFSVGQSTTTTTTTTTITRVQHPPSSILPRDLFILRQPLPAPLLNSAYFLPSPSINIISTLSFPTRAPAKWRENLRDDAALRARKKRKNLKCKNFLRLFYKWRTIRF